MLVAVTLRRCGVDAERGSTRIQETAANQLGRWNDESVASALADLARSGSHNGRMAALRALMKMDGPVASAAVEELRRARPGE